MTKMWLLFIVKLARFLVFHFYFFWELTLDFEQRGLVKKVKESLFYIGSLK